MCLYSVANYLFLNTFYPPVYKERHFQYFIHFINMTPLEYFHNLFSTIESIAVMFELRIFRPNFKATIGTWLIFSSMFVAIPLIIYTVVTYELLVALRALSVIGMTLQVKCNFYEIVTFFVIKLIYRATLSSWRLLNQLVM